MRGTKLTRKQIQHPKRLKRKKDFPQRHRRDKQTVTLIHKINGPRGPRTSDVLPSEFIGFHALRATSTSILAAINSRCFFPVPFVVLPLVRLRLPPRSLSGIYSCSYPPFFLLLHSSLSLPSLILADRQADLQLI